MRSLKSGQHGTARGDHKSLSLQRPQGIECNSVSCKASSATVSFWYLRMCLPIPARKSGRSLLQHTLVLCTFMSLADKSLQTDSDDDDVQGANIIFCIPDVGNLMSASAQSSRWITAVLIWGQKHITIHGASHAMQAQNLLQRKPQELSHHPLAHKISCSSQAD